MTDYPLAMKPHDQPAVNQLTDEARSYCDKITARNWQSTAGDFSQRVSQLYTLTGIPNIAPFIAGT